MNEEKSYDKRLDGQDMAIKGILTSNFGEADVDIVESTVEAIRVENTKNRILHFENVTRFFLYSGAAAAAALLLILVTTNSQHKRDVARLESENISMKQAYEKELTNISLSSMQEQSKLRIEKRILESKLKYLAELHAQNKPVQPDFLKNFSRNSDKELVTSSAPFKLLNNRLFEQISAIDSIEINPTPKALSQGDSVTTGKAPTILNIGTFATIQAAAHSTIMNKGKSGKEHLLLTRGSIFCDVIPGQGEFTVETKLGTIQVTGTKFEVALEVVNNREIMRVYVQEGSVVCKEKSGAVIKLGAGMTHIVS